MLLLVLLYLCAQLAEGASTTISFHKTLSADYSIPDGVSVSATLTHDDGMPDLYNVSISIALDLGYRRVPVSPTTFSISHTPADATGASGKLALRCDLGVPYGNKKAVCSCSVTDTYMRSEVAGGTLVSSLTKCTYAHLSTFWDAGTPSPGKWCVHLYDSAGAETDRLFYDAVHFKHPSP